MCDWLSLIHNVLLRALVSGVCERKRKNKMGKAVLVRSVGKILEELVECSSKCDCGFDWDLGF